LTLVSPSRDTPTPEQIKQQFAAGVSFILKHFDGYQQLFPRYIMVGIDHKRILVYSEHEIIDACLAAGLVDCRIMAYPVYPQNLKEISPCELLIDIDYDRLKPRVAAKRQALRIKNKTVKKIRELFQTSTTYNPTVLETGNGYHIYIVLNNTRRLEYNEKLKAICDNPSQKFLKWIAKECSCGNSDSNNTPAFKSCYWKLPHTLNSKCGQQVKVISEFNGSLQIPSALLVDFRLYLEDKDTEQQQRKFDSTVGPIHSAKFANNPQYKLSISYIINMH
jgi:hypothetical protein